MANLADSGPGERSGERPGDYVDRVNRAIDHITRNLAGELTLDEVAGVAGFSPYHFHRIFRGMVGETLHDFVQRVRLERALTLISRKERRTLTDVALECGFGSSSEFSRRFKRRFGVAPRAFDAERWRREGRARLSGTVPTNGGGGEGDVRIGQLPEGAGPDEFTVRLRDLPARRVAYVRVFRPYEGNRVAEATARLVAWARERGLAGGQWLGYQWEDPEIVPLEKCRYDMGVVVPEDAVLDGGVSEARFPQMRVAEVEMAGTVELELRALIWLYTTWLPRSGYLPDHQPGFEAFEGEPFANGAEYFRLRIQLPVIPGSALGGR